ncbi:LysM peptidoglycan-binding domain-containing protein [Coleofasciculus sp. E2-BRE-01]|jgi:5'-nucleotidase|uniref:LysM peptidoglycan-binding domain-containing protein n=1 Tax=Coleofasciculus sp. E2-BRE-01 TaxID=3069524 RepID=UPI0032F181EC
MAKTHTVKSGDTLFKIAEQYYGDGNQWNKIASANGNLAPESLKVGQKITIPD